MSGSDLFGAARGTRRIVLDGTFAHWRAHARTLLAEGVDADAVEYVDASLVEDAADGLFGGGAPEPTLPPAPPPNVPNLPRAVVDELRTAACFRSADVWTILHRVALRVARGERDLLGDSLDADVVALGRMSKAVRRDAHKMHAFVRFRRIDDASARNGERFVAWYRPSHRIVEREAGFFQRRFPSMDWSILTPDRCAHWDGDTVRFTDGLPREAAPTDDDFEELWCSYYASVFNPARVKLDAMRAEMPKKFWDVLPETRQMDDLLADVPRRLEEMRMNSRAMADSAAPFVPTGAGLAELAGALEACEGCALCRNGTRAVAGVGPTDARIALLGEQPGDMEERAGRPFIGPAGEVLDAALHAAGLDRASLYVTNTVKHFRHEPRGKRRLHKRPTVEHVSRCQPWIDAEFEALRPDVVVCLGVTAGRAVFGPTHRAPDPAGMPRARSSRYAARTLVTFHPAAILRAPDLARRMALTRHLEETLRAAVSATEEA